jgi:hypothetical protein
MKSGKQRRTEIKTKRRQRADKRIKARKEQDRRFQPFRVVPVNEELLAPNNSYGAPEFVRRGYYADRSFRCVDCNKEEVWTGTQQKWWYEVAKGFAYSTAVRCRVCRRKERARREEARQVHLQGVLEKNLRKKGKKSS